MYIAHILQCVHQKLCILNTNYSMSTKIYMYCIHIEACPQKSMYIARTLQGVHLKQCKLQTQYSEFIKNYCIHTYYSLSTKNFVFFSHITQNHKIRPNQSTNNRDMLEHAKSDVVIYIYLITKKLSF